MEASSDLFKDRVDGGRRLAKEISRRGLLGRDGVVLGIPRGGVVVAAQVAEKLGVPLDVIITRKIRAPSQPELGIGAVVDGTHIVVLNDDLVKAVRATPTYLEEEIAAQSAEIDRRLDSYRSGRPAVDISGKTVMVVDDGIATGYTFRAALEGLRQKNPGKLFAAAPVAARDSAEMLASFADEVICLLTPLNFGAVGYWYRDFTQVSDEEVVEILYRAWSTSAAVLPKAS
jgi:putative phosphoribosyl transferase